MRKAILAVFALAAALFLAACGTTTGAVVSGVLVAGARVFTSVSGSAAEHDALCTYYNEHRAEIESVREYYKANWTQVPEKDKPALLKINEQLVACDAPATTVTTPEKRTTARALLGAFKRAVEIYRELKAAGVL